MYLVLISAAVKRFKTEHYFKKRIIKEVADVLRGAPYQPGGSSYKQGCTFLSPAHEVGAGDIVIIISGCASAFRFRTISRKPLG